MLWSFRQVASVAAARRDPAGRENLGPLASQWQERNREAFLSGYRETPGISDLIPDDLLHVRQLSGLFELDRAAGRFARSR
jgi:predicted trehalose synthase